MANDYLGPHLAFDRGIELVTYAKKGEEHRLPQRQEAPPSELGGKARLDSLLEQPTLDGALEEAIRPHLKNLEVLVPSRFQAQFDRTTGAISKVLKDDASGEISLSPDEKRILERVESLLLSDGKLRSLVQMYRSVLYQG